MKVYEVVHLDNEDGTTTCGLYLNRGDALRRCRQERRKVLAQITDRFVNGVALHRRVRGVETREFRASFTGPVSFKGYLRKNYWWKQIHTVVELEVTE